MSEVKLRAAVTRCKGCGQILEVKCPKCHSLMYIYEHGEYCHCKHCDLEIDATDPEESYIID